MKLKLNEEERNIAMENYNYYNDPRVQAGLRGKWYETFDKRSMTVDVRLYLEPKDDSDYSDEILVTFPVHYEVCDGCEGHGRMVNPSMDAGGISGEDMYDDPDFAEAYFGGAYDQKCSTCNGEKVIPTISETGLSEELKLRLKQLREQQEDQEASFQEMMAERRMGA